MKEMQPNMSKPMTVIIKRLAPVAPVPVESSFKSSLWRPANAKANFCLIESIYSYTWFSVSNYKKEYGVFGIKGDLYFNF